ncbi:hypothetical protein M758_4G256100 [Ceratodon purpureus]|nr:hypothetical protein M758_4G256100 [Ceratodon purpureus]
MLFMWIHGAVIGFSSFFSSCTAISTVEMPMMRGVACQRNHVLLSSEELMDGEVWCKS